MKTAWQVCRIVAWSIVFAVGLCITGFLALATLGLLLPAFEATNDLFERTIQAILDDE